MSHDFIVIDQNQLQRSEAITAVIDRCRRDNLKVLLPDVTGFEFSNVKDPRQTWLRCLSHLAPHAEFVEVGRKVSHLWRDEIARGAASSDLAEEGATQIFRGMLRDLADGDHSQIDSVLQGPVRELMADSLAYWSNHDRNKAKICVVHDRLKSSLKWAGRARTSLVGNWRA